jgi:cytochrome c2
MPALRTRRAWLAAGLALVVAAGAVFANHRFAERDVRQRAEALTGGRVERGRDLFAAKGCGGCHTVSGVPGADGLVGPPLDGVAGRAVIAGKLANTPANLERWISAPQSVVPDNAMPDMPMTAQESSDIAAFLYTRT